MKKILFFATIALFFACKKNEKSLNYPIDKQITGLGSTIKLKPTKTTINLNDYFADVTAIDSITGAKQFKFEQSNDKSELNISFNHNEIPTVSEVKFWIKGTPYSILMEKSRKIFQRYTFNPKGKTYKTVELKGDFNNWIPALTKMEFKDSLWQTTMVLNPGWYQYLIVADGKDMTDPVCRDSVDNTKGGFHSVMLVGKIKTKGIAKLSPSNTSDDKIILTSDNKTDEIIAFWQNYRLPADFIQNNDSTIEISIPKESEQLDRSFIRIWAYNKEGLSNDILIPLEKDKPITKTKQLNRFDWEASVFYFLMVDRFNNGNKANDKKVDNPKVDPKANYYGGDLAGITAKIKDKYFDSMGVNTIWFTPITQNPYDAWAEFPAPHRLFSGYHGYWPLTLTTVDTRYGTSDELKELIKTAHDNNMNVVLDYVAHHVHKNNKMIQDHPDWKTKMDLPNGKKNIRIWEEQRLTTWFDDFLPTFDFTKPEVVNTVSDSAVYFAKLYDFDGFRHDATKHIPEEFWRAVTKKIKNDIIIPQNKRFYQIGETFGSRELIGSYVSSGQQDAQFDFAVYFDARNTFAYDKESFEKLNSSLLETFSYYGWHHTMGNITGNHDITRFITLAGESLKQGENDREVGWHREVKVENPVGYKKLSSMTAFLMTIPGIPIMFYGDEFGMAGANDPDNRRPMQFGNLSKDEQLVKETAQKLIKLRREKLALMYGDFNPLLVTKMTYAYSRTYFGESAIVIFNRDSKPQTIDFKIPKNMMSLKFWENFGAKCNRELDKITIELPANSFEILTN